MSLTFHDVAACFSEEEWTLLCEKRKVIYRKAMKEIHRAVVLLGYRILNPETLLRVIKWEDSSDMRRETQLHDPRLSPHPANGPTPDIFLKIKYEEDETCIAPDGSEETERETVKLESIPTSGGPLNSASSQWSWEGVGHVEDPGLGNPSPNAETFPLVIKWENANHEDPGNQKRGEDKGRLYYDPAKSPIPYIKQEEEQICKDPVEGEDMNSLHTGHFAASDMALRIKKEVELCPTVTPDSEGLVGVNRVPGRKLEATYVISQKGHRQLSHDGYLYCSEKKIKDTEIWKCIKYHTVKCRGRAKTKENLIMYTKEHCHWPDSMEVEKKKILAKMQEKARQSSESTGTILKDIMQDVPLAVAGSLPRTSALKRRIINQRNKKTDSPKVPKQGGSRISTRNNKPTVRKRNSKV